jgi:DNA-3-methyladenine glycosylase II
VSEENEKAPPLSTSGTSVWSRPTTSSHTAQLVPVGPFSLEAAATFGFGPTQGQPLSFDGAMRLAFPVDGGSGYAGAVLRQSAADQEITVELQSTKTADPELALKQIARIISVDYDGNEFLGVGERDRIIAELQARFSGHRPVLFHSPYEAAAWSIISARKPSAAAARTRTALSERLGHSFTLAGETVHAFPQPDALSDLSDFPGLDQTKARRLEKIADAGAELQADALKSRGPEDAFIYAQTLEGIGPFYASLIVLRGTGFADAPLRIPEPRTLNYAAELYDAQQLSLEHLTQLAENWRPFRTWSTVLIRIAAAHAKGQQRVTSSGVRPPRDIR